MAASDDSLGMGTPIERRDLLHGLAAGIGTALLPGITAAAPGAEYYPPARLGLSGSHPGSFEGAHALRDGTLKPGDAAATGERYDLIVVGGGISGLAAARFQRAERPDARIPILDNHDDSAIDQSHRAVRELLAAPEVRL